LHTGNDCPAPTTKNKQGLIVRCEKNILKKKRISKETIFIFSGWVGAAFAWLLRAYSHCKSRAKRVTANKRLGIGF